MTIQRNSDNSAVVDRNYHWQKIDKDTPKGSKLQLINRRAGSAQYGILDAKNKFGYTHWAACPTFKEDE